MSIVLGSSLETVSLTSKQLKQIAIDFPHSSLDEAVNIMVRNSIDQRKKRVSQKGQNVLCFNRRRSDYVNAYEMYEQDKRMLEAENLTANQYQVERKKPADTWRI